jgi:AcrR family transcriptional regulator
MNSERLGRRARKELTRQLLIEAAAAVFARRGFDAASLDEIAEAAGFTKGAVYSNFRSKTDLMMSLIERRVAEQAAAIARALSGITLEQVLQRLGSASDPGAGSDLDWLRLVAEFWQYAMRNESARVAMAEQYERARTISARMIAEKYAEAGAEPPMPVRDLAILVEAISIGVSFQAALDPSAVPATVQGEATRRLLAPLRDSGTAAT